VDHRLIGIQDSNQVDRQVRSACADAGLEVCAPLHGFFFAAVRRLVAEGAGVAIVDTLNGCQELNDGVSWRVFTPEVQYKLALITKAGAELSSPAQAFLRQLGGDIRAAADKPVSRAV